MSTRRLTPAVATMALWAAFVAQAAHAGLFDDEEARQRIVNLTDKVNERVDTLSRAQIELVNQIQALRDENAKLQGQVETLQYELESAKKRQQDFYVDLDSRMRKIEPNTSTNAPLHSGGETTARLSTPALEVNEYEAALNLFKANKIKESAAAFDTFAKTYPNGALTPNAYYWQANALTALRDCKRAIDVYRVVVAKWPQNPRAPDALMGVASCQQDLSDIRSSRMTLEAVIVKYPDSSAATTARQRLKK